MLYRKARCASHSFSGGWCNECPADRDRSESSGCCTPCRHRPAEALSGDGPSHFFVPTPESSTLRIPGPHAADPGSARRPLACPSLPPAGEPWCQSPLGSGLAPGPRSPFGSSGVLMGPDHGAIHEMYSPLQLASGIGLLLQLPQESLPQPLSPPPVETAGYRRPGAISFWQVSPRGTGAHHPQNAIDDGPMVFAGPSEAWPLGWQQRR